ncbi:unnamed protein product [Cylicocyclus nassatus]|uniref:Tyrosine phosphatase n=1 Tax=Cylicocyclus nassatus TaxID=53992 RepID=A0AA36MA21_CYLNA|nr:unnamed protein product [Cylicocyclus nassatus]
MATRTADQPPPANTLTTTTSASATEEEQPLKVAAKKRRKKRPTLRLRKKGTHKSCSVEEGQDTAKVSKEALTLEKIKKTAVNKINPRNSKIVLKNKNSKVALKASKNSKVTLNKKESREVPARNTPSREVKSLPKSLSKEQRKADHPGNRNTQPTMSTEDDLTSTREEFNVLLKTSKDARLVWLTRILQKGIGYLMIRYRKNLRYTSRRATTVASKANMSKNRYGDVGCIDETRVVLRNWPSNYINANWVVLPNGRRFICAQAPMKTTVCDFWHMILQENCRMIIMLCDLIEGEKEKCIKYFPQQKGQALTFGTTKVTLIEQSSSAYGFTISTWKVEDRSHQCNIKHLQLTAWPDHSAPKSPSAIIGIHKEIMKTSHETLILIHCSAGIGRTCTIMGVEVLLERIRRRRDVSGVAVMKWLRDRRFGAIQKGVQFVFMHYVVIELLVQDGVMKSNDPKLVAFRQKYEKLWNRLQKAQIKARKELELMKTQCDETEAAAPAKLQREYNLDESQNSDETKEFMDDEDFDSMKGIEILQENFRKLNATPTS